jgi:quercetin dioxygenase-like cupin family protein
MNEKASTKMREPRMRVAAAVAFGVGFLLLVGVALATPGMGVLSTPVHARGTLEPTSGDNLIVNSKSGVHVKTKGSVDLVTQELNFAPGGHTGWHSHPGPVLVTVKAGSLQLIYADDETCQGTVYEAGDSFVDRGDERVHIARASPFDGMVLWATYFVPGTAGTTPFRIDEPDPGTGC